MQSFANGAIGYTTEADSVLLLPTPSAAYMVRDDMSPLDVPIQIETPSLQEFVPAMPMEPIVLQRQADPPTGLLAEAEPAALQPLMNFDTGDQYTGHQYVEFTYYYGNGDSYRGNGYTLWGTYVSGQVLGVYSNDGFFVGYYVIDSVEDLDGLGSLGGIKTNANYDAATDSDGIGVGGSGYARDVWGEGEDTWRLGSEVGFAFNANVDWTGDNSFTNYDSADISLATPAYSLQVFDFTNYHGDGDFYSGYAIASSGTHYVVQVITDFSNDTSQLGYYYIWSAQNTVSDSDVQGSVHVHTYYDGSTDFNGLGRGGYGYADYVYAEGYYGLGSEFGYAYALDNEWTDDNYFSNSSSAAIFSTSGGQRYGQRFRFTYYFGNGDFYNGYGYTSSGTYQAGQVIGDFLNDTNNWGHYVIDFVDNLGYDSRLDGAVFIYSYFDAATDVDGKGVGAYGTAAVAYGEGYGLGSEIGFAYNWEYDWTYDNIISNSNSADLILGTQQYGYSYYYGNGDYYRGFGYAVFGTYATGQWLPGVSNDTNNIGYYIIDYVQELGYNTAENNVFITDYFDAAKDLDGLGGSGSGYASYVMGEGYAGLGSESGEAYNSDYHLTGDNFISNSNSADISIEQLQIFVFAYYYGDGDFYRGYGYADADTYTVGDIIGYFSNDTSDLGYYVIEYTYAASYYGYSDGFIVIDSYYDATTDLDGVGVGGSGYASSVYGYGYYGLGSESGEVYNENHQWTGDNYFSNSSSADILYPGNQEFGFTYQYGNGDYYTGIGFAALGFYFAGQTIGFYANDTGNTGYYAINYVAEHLDYVQENGTIFLDMYYDAETDSDGIGRSQHGAAYIVGGGGLSGLGSESGEAYNYDLQSSGDNYFSTSSSADLAYNTDQLFEFTYYYGDGDSYGGYGYANADTYYAGQRLESFANDTGYLGYYIIDSVADLGFETDNIGAVFVNRYYDANTDLDGLGFGAQGSAANVSGESYGGLGSEIGAAYNSSFDWSYDNIFSAANSADLAMSGYQEFGFTYYYGDGDYYTGYGHASGDLYYAGQIISGVHNDTGNVGYYVIEFARSLPAASYAGDHILLETYYDFATDLDGIATGSYGYAYSCWGAAAAGLGSEYGEAYGADYAATGDNAFSASSSADLFPPATFFLMASSADKAEGDSGFTRFNFNVSRSGDLSSTASVNWSVIGSGNDPVDAVDFLAGAFRSGIVRFAAGEQTRALSIRIKGDFIHEQDEQFTLSIFNPVGGSLDPTHAEVIGIIRNDDALPPPQPTLSLFATAADKTEGDGSSKKFRFTVTRTGHLTQSCSVGWSVVGRGVNPAGTDDLAKGRFRSGKIRFAEGEATRDITIRVSGDTLYEQDEQFTVSLFNPVGASIDTNFIEAIGTIRNDDPLPSPVLAIAATAADKLEGSGSKRFTFTVTRSGDLSQSSSAEWFLSGSGLDPASPDDFLTERFDSGVIRFEADQSSRELSIRIRGDLTPEPDEQFTVALFNPIGASLDLSATEAIGIIRNDDFSSSSALTSAPATLWQPMAGMPRIGGT